jgi:hypothetical protein
VKRLEKPTGTDSRHELDWVRRDILIVLSPTEDTNCGIYTSEEPSFAVLASKVRWRGVNVGN